jgi:hypothetical protein
LIFSVFDCSTGHITKEDSEILKTIHDEESHLVAEYPEGFFVWIGTKEEAKFLYAKDEPLSRLSDSFKAAAALARSKGCTYICFDCDGEEYEELEEHEW